MLPRPPPVPQRRVFSSLSLFGSDKREDSLSAVHSELVLFHTGGRPSKHNLQLSPGMLPRPPPVPQRSKRPVLLRRSKPVLPLPLLLLPPNDEFSGGNAPAWWARRSGLVDSVDAPPAATGAAAEQTPCPPPPLEANSWESLVGTAMCAGGPVLPLPLLLLPPNDEFSGGNAPAWWARRSGQ
jgi:hypothetical protein